MQRFTVLVIIALCSSIVCAQETKPKLLTPETIVGFASVSGGAVSPDATRVIYVKSAVDLSTSGTKRSLWMADVASGESRQFTRGDGNDMAPRWSPDGRSIAFISTRTFRTVDGELEKGAQLWLIPATFGEARQLTALPQGVNDWRWSPDGTSIYCTSTESLSPEKEAEQVAKRKRRDDGHVVDSELLREQFYAVNVATGETKLLATAHAGIDGFEVSPDGARIVYATNYTGKMDDDLSFDLWLLGTGDGVLKQLTAFPGPETSPVWSPDGARIAYVSTTAPNIEYAQTDLTVIDAAPGAQPRVLTGDFDREVNEIHWNSPNRIWCTVIDGVRTPLYWIDPTAAKPAMQPGNTAGMNVGAFDVAANGRIFFLGEKFPLLPDYYLTSGETALPVKITDMSAQLAGYAIAPQKVIHWTSEGQELEGVLTLPVGYTEGQKYPAILHCHGGPFGRVTDAFSASWQAFAAAGYAVVAANYRGSSGYGESFARSLNNDFGGVDYRDSISAVDEAIRLGVADPDRLGVTGGSWGGYLTNWTITQTNRFKAAVSMFGVFSFRTDMSNSIQSTFEKMYFGGHYWEGNPKYDERSPQTYVTRINTPTLIMHGEVDNLTFIANSNELYTALRLMGKTVQYVKYPREGHGFREPVHRVDSMQRSIDWFNTYLRTLDKEKM